MSTRRQVNVRLDPETIDDIEVARHLVWPTPTISEVFRVALSEYVARLRKKQNARPRK